MIEILIIFDLPKSQTLKKMFNLFLEPLNIKLKKGDLSPLFECRFTEHFFCVVL